ncbi:hypothetical protein SLEP1_g46492 [Rubroshorea leprosula]|uniref:Uncharacterized protein n=1 Tax=Rubroshorea leprosula TaxID=152421 RepID=A0AAV5LPU7_9ROSI|nr:hypothetical protein SLEP1_g46492 [Rubroshorea leprosula]
MTGWGCTCSLLCRKIQECDHSCCISFEEMWYDPSLALEYVKSKRPQAAPNSGFLSQLQEFEKSLQGA